MRESVCGGGSLGGRSESRRTLFVGDEKLYCVILQTTIGADTYVYNVVT